MTKLIQKGQLTKLIQKHRFQTNSFKNTDSRQTHSKTQTPDKLIQKHGRQASLSDTLSPNSAVFGYRPEGALLIFAPLSTHTHTNTLMNTHTYMHTHMHVPPPHTHMSAHIHTHTHPHTGMHPPPHTHTHECTPHTHTHTHEHTNTTHTHMRNTHTQQQQSQAEHQPPWNAAGTAWPVSPRRTPPARTSCSREGRGASPPGGAWQQNGSADHLQEPFLKEW